MSRTAISDPSPRVCVAAACEKRCSPPGEHGFTLAALLVILTVIMVMVAYTVPRMWSKVVRRDQDKQTVFIMRQYARAILEYQKSHNGTYPVSLDQLKEARKPRVVRGPKGEWTDPLTGKVDWVLIPPAVLGAVAAPGGPGSGYNPSPLNPQYAQQQQPQQQPRPQQPAAPASTDTTNTPATATPAGSADYKGPFVGVRPNKTGSSYLKVKNEEKYEKWILTSEDVKQEISARISGGQPIPGGAPISGGLPNGTIPAPGTPPSSVPKP